MTHHLIPAKRAHWHTARNTYAAIFDWQAFAAVMLIVLQLPFWAAIGG